MSRIFGRVTPQPRAAVRPARNAQCRCGSGKKYKRCCGRERSGTGDVARVDLAQLDVLLRARRYDELERAARALLVRVPNCGVAWKALSLSLASQGKDALDAFTRAAQLLADDADSVRDAPRMQSQAVGALWRSTRVPWLRTST